MSYPVVWRHEAAEITRLAEDTDRKQNWKRWGPYLSERQWGTVREDYSEDGGCWEYFTHDMARSRAYRWGEDGLMGFTDRQCRLCFGLSLWNENDAILKERLFGLINSQGNHGEDVKECYYYQDATPTYSYMKSLYKYPQASYPYSLLEEVNQNRDVNQDEYELLDTGVFNENRHFDVTAEYAKSAPDEVLGIITVTNCGPETATCHVLPTLWYRNTWIWGCTHEGCTMKPSIRKLGDASVICKHENLHDVEFYWDVDQSGKSPEVYYTENETNSPKLYGVDNYTPYVKDAFHRYVINGEKDAISPNGRGTKVAAHYALNLKPGESYKIRVKMQPKGASEGNPFEKAIFDDVFANRIAEADDFYSKIICDKLNKDEVQLQRQAFASLLHSKQFYHYVVKDWLEGDPEQPPPPSSRWEGRNTDWMHLFNRDIISMPDKWEYPWYAAWDLAFHMIPMARIDPTFAKQQLELFLREWYLSPNGQIPAYEFNFSDVNPPVHAAGVMAVYKFSGEKGNRDNSFLAKCFQKLIMNFTWWLNRKDPFGKNIFGGGFLGLDNIGVFDRSQPLPPELGVLEQADGTAWMGFFCLTMLNMALDLAVHDHTYEDMASKFFEHFIAIVDAINHPETGLWDDEDGFYYDRLRKHNGCSLPLRIRSMVGLIPLYTVTVLETEIVNQLPGFKKRLDWFLRNRKDLSEHMARRSDGGDGEYNLLLSIVSPKRFKRIMAYMLDEGEFLSPYGIRSLSKYHDANPYEINLHGKCYSVKYTPGESRSNLFGGNSNWRGPIWFPVNYLLIAVMDRYQFFYGDELKFDFPTGSGNQLTLKEIGVELAHRCSKLFLPDETGRRPCHGDDEKYWKDANWKDEILFYEFFDGDTGRGCGASHQTGWTALVADLIDKVGLSRP